MSYQSNINKESLDTNGVLRNPGPEACFVKAHVHHKEMNYPRSAVGVNVTRVTA